MIAPVQSGKALSVRETSKPKASAPATGMTIAGQHLRIALADPDTRNFERLGGPLADAVEPCPHVRAAARLMTEDPRGLRPTMAAARAQAR